MSTVSEEEMKAHERLTQWADVYAKLSPDGEEETFMADLRLLLSRPSLPSGDAVPVGWQYRLSQEVADRADAHAIKVGKPALGRRWVFAIHPTKEEAERAAYGGADDNPLNEVRPLYDRPSLPSGDGWRPIESAPRDKTMVALLHAGTMGGRPFWRYGVGWWMPLDGWQGWFLDVGGDRRAPTHWMPLPSAPSGEG